MLKAQAVDEGRAEGRADADKLRTDAEAESEKCLTAGKLAALEFKESFMREAFIEGHNISYTMGNVAATAE
jgi:hypothetical protein